MLAEPQWYLLERPRDRLVTPGQLRIRLGFVDAPGGGDVASAGSALRAASTNSSRHDVLAGLLTPEAVETDWQLLKSFTHSDLRRTPSPRLGRSRPPLALTNPALGGSTGQLTLPLATPASAGPVASAARSGSPQGSLVPTMSALNRMNSTGHLKVTPRNGVGDATRSLEELALSETSTSASAASQPASTSPTRLGDEPVGKAAVDTAPPPPATSAHPLLDRLLRNSQQPSSAAGGSVRRAKPPTPPSAPRGLSPNVPHPSSPSTASAVETARGAAAITTTALISVQPEAAALVGPALMADLDAWADTAARETGPGPSVGATDVAVLEGAPVTAATAAPTVRSPAVGAGRTIAMLITANDAEFTCGIYTEWHKCRWRAAERTGVFRNPYADGLVRGAVVGDGHRAAHQPRRHRNSDAHAGAAGVLARVWRAGAGAGPHRPPRRRL